MGGPIAISSGDLISLRSGGATVEVARAIGGSIASYCTEVDGRRFDWLRPADMATIATATAGDMGCFPLVPYSNRVRDGRFTFRGRQIQLPSRRSTDPHFEHGHGWRNSWNVEACTPTSIEMRFEHLPDAWPWAYAARQKFVLSETSLEIGLSIQNMSREPMPCGFGLHPYFPRTAQCRLVAEVAGMWTINAEILPVAHGPCPTASNPAVGLLVDQVNLDNVFTGWNGVARIIWPERNASLIIEASAPLGCLVIYTPRHEPYFCVEPVSNITDAFNLAETDEIATGLIVLGPGETAVSEVRLTPRIEAFN